MSADTARNTHGDVRFAPVGMGMVIRMHCFGCQASRPTLGCKGVGVRRRCAKCVEAKAARGEIAA